MGFYRSFIEVYRGFIEFLYVFIQVFFISETLHIVLPIFET